MSDSKSFQSHLIEKYRGRKAPQGFIESAVEAINLANSGQTEKAIASGEQAVSLAERDPRGHAALAYALWVGGQSEQAVGSADRSLELSDGDQLAQLVRSAALTNLGRHEDAADAAYAALKQWPDDQTVLRAAAASGIQAARYSTALEAATKLSKALPADGQAHLMVGLSLSGMHRLADAEAAYRDGLARVPDDAELLNGLGFTLVLLGRAVEAENYLRQSLKMKSSWYTFGSLAACLISLADSYKDDDLYGEAIATVDAALVLAAANNADADEHGRLYLQRGYAFARVRNVGKARLDFKTATVKARPLSTVSLVAGRNLRRINVSILRTAEPPGWLPHGLGIAAVLLSVYAGIAFWSGHLDQNGFIELVFGSVIVIIAGYSLPNLTRLKLGTVELEKQVSVVPDIPLEVLHVG